MPQQLTALERVQYQTWLTEAQQALHDVAIGGKPKVFVDQTGERVEYSATNPLALRKYILELQIALGNIDVARPLSPWM